MTMYILKDAKGRVVQKWDLPEGAHELPEDVQVIESAEAFEAIEVYVEDTRSDEEKIVAQIYELEMSITPRRLREAVLGMDNGWLATKNTEISALRQKL